jgi:hypothetical protein
MISRTKLRLSLREGKMRLCKITMGVSAILLTSSIPWLPACTKDAQIAEAVSGTASAPPPAPPAPPPAASAPAPAPPAPAPAPPAPPPAPPAPPPAASARRIAPAPRVAPAPPATTSGYSYGYGASGAQTPSTPYFNGSGSSDAQTPPSPYYHGYSYVSPSDTRTPVINPPAPAYSPPATSYAPTPSYAPDASGERNCAFCR